MTVKKEKVRSGIWTVEVSRGIIEDIGPVIKTLSPKASKASTIIEAYTDRAISILEATPYPTTIDALFELEPETLPVQIQEIRLMFFHFEKAQEAIQSKDAEGSGWHMALGITAAIRAQIRPIEPHVFRGVKTISSASKGGEAKRLTDTARHEQWQKDAETIWKQYPSYAKWRVAEMLANKYADDSELSAKKDTIYRKIKK